MSTDNTNTIAGTDGKDKITIKNEGTTNEPTKLWQYAVYRTK